MDNLESSRRDFLTRSARMAAMAGIATVGSGCTQSGSGMNLFARGPKIDTIAGPRPRTIGPNDTLRFGLIGIGSQGRHDLHRLLQNKNIEVVAIADPDANNARQAAEQVKNGTGKTLEIYNGFDDWKEKLLARDDIDAILTATPCYMHGPVALGCFAAGKHFYSEKPMATEAHEADALVEAQHKNPHVKGQVGYQRRATKLYAEGIRRIRDGLIGETIDGRGSWNNSWGPIGLPQETAEGWMGRIWLGRRQYSGDWMLEQACHTWDVFNWVTDGVAPIGASGFGRRDVFADIDPKRDVTDFYFAHLEYPGGFLVDYEHSWLCPKSDHQEKFGGVFERVAGRKGGICLNEGTFYPREGGPENVVNYAPEEGDHIQLSINAFLDSIRHDRPVCSGVINGRLATYTGLLVRKAVDEQRWVEMKELGYRPMSL